MLKFGVNEIVFFDIPSTKNNKSKTSIETFRFANVT